MRVCVFLQLVRLVYDRKAAQRQLDEEEKELQAAKALMDNNTEASKATLILLQQDSLRLGKEQKAEQATLDALLKTKQQLEDAIREENARHDKYEPLCNPLFVSAHWTLLVASGLGYPGCCLKVALSFAVFRLFLSFFLILLSRSAVAKASSAAADRFQLLKPVESAELVALRLQSENNRVEAILQAEAEERGRREREATRAAEERAAMEEVMGHTHIRAHSH